MANGVTKTKAQSRKKAKEGKGKHTSGSTGSTKTKEMSGSTNKNTSKNTGGVKKSGSTGKTQTMVKKAGLFGPLNPFRKKVKNEDGSTTTYNRITGKKVKEKGKDKDGNTYKMKFKGKDGQISKFKQKDSKIKFDKKTGKERKTKEGGNFMFPKTKTKYNKKTGNIRKRKTINRNEEGFIGYQGQTKEKFDSEGDIKKYKKTKLGARSEKIKFKKDKETGANIVRKAKNTKPGYDASGQMDGTTERSAGYKYKVKKKGDGVQVKEKGVDVPGIGGGTKKGTRKTRYDADGNQISVKTRPGGLHTATKTEGDGSKFQPKGDFSNVKTSTTTPTKTETPTTTTPTTETETKTETKDTNTASTYGSKRAKYASENVPDAKFNEKDGTKNLRSYKEVWKTDKATRDKYGNDYSKYTKDAESYWKKKGLSRGGERRLGGAITGQARYGGSMGPQGVL